MNLFDTVDSSPTFLGWAIGFLVLLCIVSHAVESRIRRTEREP